MTPCNSTRDGCVDGFLTPSPCRDDTDGAPDNGFQVTEADPDEVDFELQAILASLPKHAVPSTTMRACGATEVLTACHGGRPRPNPAVQTDEEMCATRVRAAMAQARYDYPRHGHILSRLDVVYASLDVVCFADHKQERLFIAARGTDRAVNPLTFPRDWNNNVSVFLGRVPQRHVQAGHDYLRVKARYPTYASYGTGHSLGGSVILHMAEHVQVVEESCGAQHCSSARFVRIDVFNVAISPFWSTLPQDVEVHFHRTEGDFASRALLREKLPERGQLHIHPVKPSGIDAHALSHFMPKKTVSLVADDAEPLERQQIGASDKSWAAKLLGVFSVVNCVGSRGKQTPLLNGGSSVPPRMEPRVEIAPRSLGEIRCAQCGDDAMGMSSAVGRTVAS